MNWRVTSLLCLFTFLLIPGCTDSTAYVPVTEAWREPINSSTRYTVKAGDTLYSIAWSYGLDFRRVATMNKISPPYHVHTGQRLKMPTAVRKSPLNPPFSKAEILEKQHSSDALKKDANPKTKKASEAKTLSDRKLAEETLASEVSDSNSTNSDTDIKVQVNCSANEGITWAWPARGAIIHSFCTPMLNKGLDIAAKKGSPITAAANGKVVYAGNGLRGYGELVILKHNDDFLSAYAHNQKLLVAEGQSVKIGQVIALMGNTEAKQILVHFEIRKAGKPVDPLKYLPKN